MSPPPVPLGSAVRQCYAKRRFSSRKDARDAANRTLRASAFQTWPYYCNLCRAYHLTSQSPKVQKERRRRLRERETAR